MCVPSSLLHSMEVTIHLERQGAEGLPMELCDKMFGRRARRKGAHP